jgi:D-alanyl-D-alanine carboxypeptidase (penicillin-binding protein 5/6)
MTARELAMLARYLISEFPEYYSMFAQKEFLYRKHRFINRNPLLFTDIGADGLKTGYVKDSGYGLVASAVRGDMRLIAVVMGLSSSEARKLEGRRLLEWGFNNVAPYKLFDAGEIVAHARVWGGDRLFTPLSSRGDLSVYLPRLPADPKLRADVTYKGPLKPPVRMGDQVAILRITSSTDAVNEVPLYAAEDVEKAGFVWRGLDSLAYLAFRWVEDHISNLVGRTSPDT